MPSLLTYLQKPAASIRKIWDRLLTKHMISDILIPLITLVTFCLSFVFFSSTIRSLPDNVTYLFVTRFLILLLIFISIYALILVFFKVRYEKEHISKDTSDKLSVGDSILLLVPLTPVVQYLINNQNILSQIDNLHVLAYIAIFSSIYIFVIPHLFSRLSTARTLMLLGFAFVTTITSMPLFSQQFAWFRSGNFIIQLLIISGVFIAFKYLYTDKNLGFIRLGIILIFVLNSSLQWLAINNNVEETTSPSTSENHLLQLLEARAPIRMPNIYFLIYDAYVSNETLLAYGIDNGTQEDYLLQKGFDLYSHTYSVASNSSATVSRVFEVSSEMTINALIPTSGDGLVQNIFTDLGYTRYGIFPHDFFFRGVGSSYDFSYPQKSSPPEILLSGIFMGEFRFDIVFDAPEREQFLASKRRIFENQSENPIFVYTHSDLPGHSQNSGACLANETTLFSERLTAANLEMQQDIETIINNNPGAIVIIAGDHGPYLTKNCSTTDEGRYDISEISRLDIQDRFGTFLAIRWPEGDFSSFDDITVLQDLFPAVFAYIFDDESLLETKIEPNTILPDVISGASVQDGIIYGGIDDGDFLFESIP